MGKTRDLFKKIRDTKGTFHAKMGTIKDRYLYRPLLLFKVLASERKISYDVTYIGNLKKD